MAHKPYFLMSSHIRIWSEHTTLIRYSRIFLRGNFIKYSYTVIIHVKCFYKWLRKNYFFKSIPTWPLTILWRSMVSGVFHSKTTLQWALAENHFKCICTAAVTLVKCNEKSFWCIVTLSFDFTCNVFCLPAIRPTSTRSSKRLVHCTW